jgi:hypothetical protein
MYHYRNDETVSKLLDMVQTLMHNQLISQNEITKLREQINANTTRIDELENRIYGRSLQDPLLLSGTISGATLTNIAGQNVTKKQRLSSLAKQYIPSKIDLSFLQYVKNSVTQPGSYDFSCPNVQLVNQILKDFSLPDDDVLSERTEEERMKRDAWYRVKITQKVENHKRDLKKSL